jgi:hypothetical protein
MWDIIWFLIKTYAFGFFVGLVLRVVIAFMLRSEMSVGGWMRSAAVIGLLYFAGVMYLIWQS